MKLLVLFGFVLSSISCGSHGLDEMEEISPGYIIHRAYGKVKYLFYAEESAREPGRILPVFLNSATVSGDAINGDGWLFDVERTPDNCLNSVIYEYVTFKINMSSKKIEIKVVHPPPRIEDFELLNSAIQYKPEIKIASNPVKVLDGFSVSVNEAR